MNPDHEGRYQVAQSQKAENGRNVKLAVGFLMLLLALCVASIVILATLLREELRKENELNTTPIYDEIDKDDKGNNNEICNTRNTIDVAVIGSGASGSFAAWQLSKNHDDWTIQLFDANNRIGGRLYSIDIDGISNHKADLGAMRFPQSHSMLKDLIMELGLTKDNFTTPTKDDTLYYMRGKLVSQDDIAAGNVPFEMTEYENSLSANIGALYEYWNNMIMANNSKSETDGFKKKFKDGTMAYERGIRNAYAGVASSEALEYIAARIGFPGFILNNINFAKSPGATVASSQPSQLSWLSTIREGFQELVNRMVQRFLQKSKNSLHLNHRLTQVTYRDNLARLMFYDKSKNQFVDVCARKVVIGVSAEALRQIHFDEDVTSDLSPLTPAVLERLAGKTYLAYDRAWWRKEGKGDMYDELRSRGNDVKYLVTDEPVGMILDIGVDKTTGKALLLSYFESKDRISFWKLYQEHGTPHSSNLPADMAVSEGYVKEIHRQFSRIFNISIDEIPQPYASVTQSWYTNPYYVGWHSVSAGFNYPDVVNKIGKPVAHRDLFIVGEAFSTIHGWTEGALQSVQNMLKQHFEITQFYD